MKNKIVIVVVLTILLFGVVFFVWKGKTKTAESLSEIFTRQISVNEPLISDNSIKLESVPFRVNKYQATEIKKYRFGKLLLLRVGRSSNGFGYQAPILEQEGDKERPSGVFASLDNGKNWIEVIASDSVLARNMLFRGIWYLEPSGIFIKDNRMFVDFFVGTGEGPLIRLTTRDGISWKEYGCYNLIPETYDKPFSLEPTVRCLSTTAQIDNWMPVGQKPAFEVNKARETLLAYLGALSMGWYEEASTMYSGNQLDRLRDWNPNVDPSNASALFETTCQRQSVCTFPITVEPTKKDLKNGLYYFDVVLPIGDFNNKQNKHFVYIVKSNVSGKYSVESLPAYTQ